MIQYLLAVILAAVLVIALWRLLGPDSGSGRGGATPRRNPRRPGSSGPPRGGVQRSQLPPDDNPDFLRELDERTRKPDDPPSR